MENTKENKQNLLREKIMYAQYDPHQFQQYMQNLEKGTDLDLYTYEELTQVIEDFILQKKAEKQEFLRVNIIQQDYDVESFIQFMSEQKIDGAFIDNWSMDELREAVDTFKSRNEVVQSSYQETNDEKNIRMSQMENFLTKSTMKQPEGEILDPNIEDEESIGHKMRQNMWQVIKKKKGLDQIQEDNEEDDNNNSDIKQKKEQQKENENSFSKINPYIEQQFTDEQLKQSEIKHKEEQQQWQKVIKQQEQKEFISKYSYQLGKQTIPPYEDKITVNQEKNRLPQNNKLRVTIPKWEMQKSGIFGLGGSYALYEINTEPFKWSVKRRLTDFFQYRKLLVKLFPGKWIPPLDTNTCESSYNDVLQRKRFLIQFIMHLKESSEIWSNAVTQIFLSENNKWDDLVAKIKDQKDPKYCVTSNTGEIKLRLSKQNQIYIEEAEKFFNDAKNEFNQLQNQTYKLQEQFQAISNQCTKIQQGHQNLIQAVNNFQIELSQKLPKSAELEQIQFDNDYLQQSYKSLSQMIQALSKSAKQQIGLSEQMSILFRYCQLDISNNEEHLKNYVNSEKSYLKFIENMEKQSRNDPAYITNPRVIGEELQVKQDYSYWQQQLYTEFQKQLYCQSTDYTQFINYMSKYETLRINELIKSWQKVTDQYFESPFPQPKIQEANNNANNMMFSVLKSNF